MVEVASKQDKQDEIYTNRTINLNNVNKLQIFNVSLQALGICFVIIHERKSKANRERRHALRKNYFDFNFIILEMQPNSVYSMKKLEQFSKTKLTVCEAFKVTLNENKKKSDTRTY